MSTQEPSLQSRAEGALLGLAVGDAAGFPALFHRTVRLGLAPVGPVALRHRAR